MTTTQLRTPILDGDLKSINFFNGRLLSGEDLSQEQTVNKRAHRNLGQAIGAGVAYGLEVKEATGLSTNQAPIITLQPGLAVNRLGQTLRLTNQNDIALVRPQQNSPTPSPALFADCQPLEAGSYVAGAGVYVLTILPASGTDGRAPVSGLGNLDAACNAKYQVDGVQFRLLQLPITQAELSDATRLRNYLAYRCFGTNDSKVTSFFANPFGPVVTNYGLLDDLRPNDCLTDDEVPLALIYWTAADGLKFVDLWSVRRRLTRAAADSAWPLLTSDRRLTEAEAMFLQFEDQIKDLRNTPNENLGTIVAANRFRYLPPVGLLPIIGPNSNNGFNWQTFFGALAPENLDLIDAAALPYLIRESFQHQPLRADDSSSGSVTLYRIRENVDAVQLGASPQLTLVFARPGLVYCGVPRFGYALWDVSRFA